MENIEKRSIEIRLGEGDDSRLIRGTAIVFNSLSGDLGGFKEIIKPEAITRELIDNSDIVMLYQHNDSQMVLARSKFGKGTLKINITATGVDFEFKAKKTPSGDEVLESVRCGDLDSCSFAFRLASGGDAWKKDIDGKYIRTISKIESLHDLSIVITPAYKATSVNTRGLDTLKDVDLIEVEKQLQAKKDLETYYSELEQKVNKYSK